MFRQCVEWAGAGDFTEQDVEEAKLGVFQKVRLNCIHLMNGCGTKSGCHFCPVQLKKSLAA